MDFITVQTDMSVNLEETKSIALSQTDLAAYLLHIYNLKKNNQLHRKQILQLICCIFIIKNLIDYIANRSCSLSAAYL